MGLSRGDRRCVYAGSDDGHTYALVAATGELLWRSETGDFVFHAPAMEAGVVYAGSDAGYVRALDAENGELLWSAAFESPVYASPVMKDGKVYISLENGYVYALFAHDLELQPESEAPARPSLSDLREGELFWRLSDRSRESGLPLRWKTVWSPSVLTILTFTRWTLLQVNHSGVSGPAAL